MEPIEPRLAGTLPAPGEMTPSPTPGSPDREWRLHWREPATPRLGLPSEDGDEVAAWAGAGDPRALQRFAAARDWPVGTVLTMQIQDALDSHSPLTHCTPADLAAWRPDASDLPPSTRSAPRHATRADARLDLFAAMRLAVTRAVDHGVLARDHGLALMLAARQAADASRPADPHSGRVEGGPSRTQRPA